MPASPLSPIAPKTLVHACETLLAWIRDWDAERAKRTQRHRYPWLPESTRYWLRADLAREIAVLANRCPWSGLRPVTTTLEADDVLTAAIDRWELVT